MPSFGTTTRAAIVRDVCLRCQFRLLLASRAHARQGHIRWSSSFPGVGGSSAAPVGGEPHEPSPNGMPSVQQPASEGSPSSYPSPLQRPSSRKSSSLAMFQSIVESQAKGPINSQVNSAPTSDTPPVASGGAASIQLVKDIAIIQNMLEKEEATIAEAYAFFEKTVYPQIKKSGAVLPQIAKNQLTNVLLNQLAAEKPRDFDSNKLPSVTRITEIMVELDALRPTIWGTLMIQLIQRILHQSTSPEDYYSIESFDSAMARRNALLRDLVGAWKAFSQQMVSEEELASAGPKTFSQRMVSEEERESAEQSPEAEQESGSPPKSKPTKPAFQEVLDAKYPKHLDSKPTLMEAMGVMFPRYQGPSLLRPTFAAYATYKLLTDPVNQTRTMRPVARPFLQMMKTLIFRSRSPRIADFGPVFENFPEMLRFMQTDGPANEGASSFVLSPVSFPRQNWEQLKIDIHQRIGQAIKIRNIGVLNKTWSDFWGPEPTPDAARIEQLIKCDELFNYFVMAYQALRRPQLAIQVWNGMERIGIKPTIKTWNSMLQGCAMCRNANGIRAVWGKVIQSGMKLDAPIWTARIAGLFACGEPDNALRALQEMAKVWSMRDDPQFANVAVQPTVGPVNAAIAGLIRCNREDDVRKVLAWAAKQGIDPDIYTFNTLLGPLVRRGDMEAIGEIFDMMRAINIKADVATFTVLLEGALSDITALTPEQQVNLVNRILHEMRSSGVPINMEAYAKIIYILLNQSGDRTGKAVKTVLAHIWRRGLELTSHIYTMMAEHYFSRDPPDSRAVTALIENRKLSENPNIDRVFWERVVKGYCQAATRLAELGYSDGMDEVQRAMAIFDRVFVPGATITFSALFELLRALVERNEMAAAKRVVDAAVTIGRSEADEEGGGEGEGGEGESQKPRASVFAAQMPPGKRYWRHRFWHLAYQYGLLDEKTQSLFFGGQRRLRR
ncbi:glutathione S-transferase-like protein [Thermochaetoides thermophila DSM 1495]|uniref:Glutathione S-transferase-like protein n=1 Tax=Chaetomium thermophilum (strain DSM 1495 / CBS 144.50 / IMI 039719) TaxID=759272 RepID=G0SHG9_CHATD|nr:glutathione S-transferase-like protein [Thermochaetoides thermophila DSM 1495]EGS17658.1 glutathione S-transferase-like protein [Thermochaetoides thermophila DSM 1495]